MKKLLKYILTNIVQHPDDIKIESKESEHGLIEITLEVHPDDMGRVIGKKGSIIDAIRKLVRIKAIITGKRINLNLVDKQQMD